MSEPSSSGIKGKFGILISGIVFLFILIIGLLGFFNRIDLFVYDWGLKTKINNAPLELSPRILPVDLNDRAERNLGEWLDSREAFADLFYIFAQTEYEYDIKLAVGMDFQFPR